MASALENSPELLGVRGLTEIGFPFRPLVVSFKDGATENVKIRTLALSFMPAEFSMHVQAYGNPSPVIPLAIWLNPHLETSMPVKRCSVVASDLPDLQEK